MTSHDYVWVGLLGIFMFGISGIRLILFPFDSSNPTFWKGCLTSVAAIGMLIALTVIIRLGG